MDSVRRRFCFSTFDRELFADPVDPDNRSLRWDSELALERSTSCR